MKFGCFHPAILPSSVLLLCYTCQPSQMQVIRFYGSNFNWLLCPMLLCFLTQLRWVAVLLHEARKKKHVLLNQLRYLWVMVKVATNQCGVESSLNRSHLPEQIITKFPVSCYLEFSDLKAGWGRVGDCHDNSGNSFYCKYFVNIMLIIIFMEQTDSGWCHRVWRCL